MIQRIKMELSKRLYGEMNYYRKLGVKIGKDCSFVGKVKFGSEPYLITLGDNVRITDGVRLITQDGGVHVIRNMYHLANIDKLGKIKVGNNVFIGTQSIIMPNVTIGNNVIIGAGSIVNKDVRDNCVVAGIPAKEICTIDDYYEKNKNSFMETKNLKPKAKKEYLVHYFDNLSNQS